MSPNQLAMSRTDGGGMGFEIPMNVKQQKRHSKYNNQLSDDLDIDEDL